MEINAINLVTFRNICNVPQNTAAAGNEVVSCRIFIAISRLEENELLLTNLIPDPQQSEDSDERVVISIQGA